MTPLVSVICTARNAAATIADTIASIVGQDFDSWEMILVDDGSSDGTQALCMGYAAQDSRIRVLSVGAIGRARALNLALHKARAPLIANIDADDVAHPARLGTQVNALRGLAEKTVLGTAAITVRGEDQCEWPVAVVDPPVPVDVTGDLTRSNPIVHSSVMFHRDPILSLGGYDERLPSAIDYDLWVRCAADGMHLARLEMPLTGKRIHRSQHFASLPKMQRLRTTLEIQRRAGATPLQLAARAAWLLIPQSIREQR